MTIESTHSNRHAIGGEAPGSGLRAPGLIASRPYPEVNGSLGEPQRPGPAIVSDRRAGARSLEPGARAGVLRLLTCGSVDDGKSTLIGRLLLDSKAILADALRALEDSSRKRGHDEVDLALLTDGLQAEREQGITIDVAYRYFSTGARSFILADAPGHEQYTRNMVTAASTADLAVLLVDARKGLQPQTRRHATLAHLLGIRHLVVAVNKMDLVDWSEAVFQRIREDFEAFARRAGVDGVRYLPLAARPGDMVVDRGTHLPWYEGPTLLELLESVDVAQDSADGPLRLPVQGVIRAGEFRGYTGRVASGRLKVGDPVRVLPSGRESRVRDIRLGDVPLAEAPAGRSVVVRLDDDLDVSRGDLLVAPEAAPALSATWEATLCWLSEAPLAPARPLILKHGARETRATVAALHQVLDVNTLAPRPAAQVGLNDIARATLRLHHPLPAAPYAGARDAGAFVLIDPATHATVAAGLIQSVA